MPDTFRDLCVELVAAINRHVPTPGDYGPMTIEVMPDLDELLDRANALLNTAPAPPVVVAPVSEIPRNCWLDDDGPCPSPCVFDDPQEIVENCTHAVMLRHAHKGKTDCKHYRDTAPAPAGGPSDDLPEKEAPCWYNSDMASAWEAGRSDGWSDALARYGTAPPPASDGEVAELVGWLRFRVQAERGLANGNEFQLRVADTFERIADLLEQQQESLRHVDPLVKAIRAAYSACGWASDKQFSDLLDEAARLAGIVEEGWDASVHATPASTVDEDATGLAAELQGVIAAYKSIHNDDHIWSLRGSGVNARLTVTMLARAADMLERRQPSPVLGVADDIADEQGRRWDRTADAALWAQAFCTIFPGSDEGLMLSWFANAIMAGWDHQRWKIEAETRPVPVTERPWEREGWCDPTGRCWLCQSPESKVWRLVKHGQDGLDFTRYRRGFLLPHDALPLPEIAK